MSHSHARNHPSVNKSIVAGVSNGMIKEGEKEERNRGLVDGDDAARQKQIWTALDLGGQSLKVVSLALFDYRFLTKLYLNSNKLSYLPPAIGRLRSLTALDLSLNELRELPPETGMLVNLRELLVFDNHLETLPPEMGSLYQLEMLGIEGNPLAEEIKSIIVEHGTSELIKFLREQAPGNKNPLVPTVVTAITCAKGVPEPDPPRDRDWIVLDETPDPTQEKLTALSYNTLCHTYATNAQYGYVPSSVLSWDRRKELILEELRARDADFVCLQEMDQESYNDYFRAHLAHNDYKGVFWPKSRARTMAEKEAKFVDGCATFYKNSK